MAFLDFLSNKAVRNAFLSGQGAFVLDRETYAIVWLDGAVASFFGFATLSAALDREEIFDNAVKRQIENGIKSGRPVRLRGQNTSASFLMAALNDEATGQYILARQTPVSNRNILDDHPQVLLEGLASDDISAAIFDGDNKIIVATETFAASGTGLQIFLASIDDFTPVKTVMDVDRTTLQVSAIRLQSEPQRFLVLAVNITGFSRQKRVQNNIKTGDNALIHFTWKMDKEGCFTYFSQQFSEKFGSVQKLIGHNLVDLDNEFKHCGFSKLQAQLASLQPWQDEKITLPDEKNGGSVEVVLSGVPVFSLNNELCSFRGFGIAKNHEAHEVETADGGLTRENAANGQEMTAPPAEKTADEEKIAGEEKTGVLNSSERSAFREIAERLRHELNLPLMERPLTGALTSPEKDAENPPLATEQFIPQSLALLNLLDTATDGVIFLDKDGRIRTFSDAASALTGYEREEVVAHPFATLFSAASQSAIKNYLACFESGGSKQIFNRGEHVKIDTREGGEIRVFVTLVPLALGQGYAALLRDMTNVSQQNRPIYDNELMARTIHEIRTPLNAMIGFAEIMGEERFGRIENERYRGYLRDIISSGKHILTLVNQFLEKAKSAHNHENHSQKEENQSAISGGFDVIVQLRKAVALLENQANENGIIIRIVMPSQVPMINIDAQEFRQIVWNLLSNAIRFTAKGGQIVVHLSVQDGEFVKVSVSDNGIGMNEEDIVRSLKHYGHVEL